MAEFGIQATFVGDTPNAVTVKDSPVDPSGATLVSTAGNAAIQGTQVYQAYKANQFGKEYDSMTEVGLGMREPETPEEKAFRSTIDRFDQMTKMGRTAGTAVAREAYLRQKVNESPFLADAYMRAAGKSESKYQSIFQAIGKLEAMQQREAAAKDAASQAWVKNRIDRLESIAQKIPGGYLPSDGQGNFVTWEEMLDNPAMLKWNEQQMFFKQQSAQVIADARADRQEARAVREERRGDITLQIQLDRRSEEIADRNGQVITERVTGEIINAMDPKIRAIADDPSLSTEEKVAAVTGLYEAAAAEAEKRLAVVGADPDIPISSTQIRAGGDAVRSQSQPWVALIEGPASENKVLTRTLEKLATKGGISMWQQNGPLMQMQQANLVTPLLTSTVLAGALETQVGAEAKTSFVRNIESLLGQVNSDPQNFKMPDTSSAEGKVIGSLGANLLIQAKQAGTESYNAFVNTPGAFANWIYPTVEQMKATADPKRQDQVFRAVVSDTSLEAIAAAPKDVQEVALSAMEDALLWRTNRMLSNKTIEQNLMYNPDTDEFQPVNDNPQFAGFATLMNDTFKYAIQVEQLSGRVSDPDNVARKYFGVSIEPIEEPDASTN